ncbi:MAG: formate dehydrogenase subunit alpha, partial [Pseudomonadota bacterium]
IEGERVLAASCIRCPSSDMVVHTDSGRAKKARSTVFEMLAADQRPREQSPDHDCDFWRWAERMSIKDASINDAGINGAKRFASKYDPEPASASNGAGDDSGHGIEAIHDLSNPAIAVNMEACIACNACVRACREVQVNDVIGMGKRGHRTVPVFDLDDPMGLSTCVTCGECVQACPTGALYEKSLMDLAGRTRVVQDFDRIVDSVCPFCGVGCQTKMMVKDNRIVQIDGRAGPANEGRLCVKGRFGYDYAMSPERLVKPLIRREGAGKDIEPYTRPFHQLFREASWEEALDLAAAKLNEIAEQKGGQAIAGFGSAKGSNEEAYLFQKFIRQGFGTNNVDHCTRLCHASSVAALLEGVGSGAVSAPFTDACKADCVMIIGARPTTNHPVAATYFKQAAKTGTKLIVMDPRKQDLMRHAAYPVQFRPGSDVALLNALLHVIIDEQLYDADYIAANVNGFEALKARVKDFSPEAMADLCGVPAQTLREIARLYATSQRSMIFWGMGISQHTHGTDNARCLIALALICGHVGREGTGLHPLRGQNNVQGASDAGLIPMMYPDYRLVDDPVNRTQMEDLWGRPLDPERGLTVVEIMDAVHEGTISGMYIMGENPAMSDPDQNHVRKGFALLDHLVVQDIFLTETCWYADVILPASAHAEKLGTYTNTNRQVQIGRPALDPPGEARQDWELICELAKRIGLDWRYGGVGDVYREMASTMNSLDFISWERLNEQDCVTYPVGGPDQPGQEVIFSDGFPSHDRRGKIVPAELLPPDECPDSQYPMVLTTGRLLEHWHTGAMTRRAAVLDAIEPEGIAAMNGHEIAKRGLQAGQMVEVSTRRGTVTAMLREDREVAENMIFMPFCFNESPANQLTNPELDPFGKIPEFKYCAARISAARSETQTQQH